MESRRSTKRVQRPQLDNKDTYEIVVEKIYQGKAVVLINDKWRARITPQDFEGPSGLIKKDARFKARGALYHDGTHYASEFEKSSSLLVAG